MVSLIDLMATFARVAGSDYRTQDSVDLLPFLKDRKEPPHDYLYWRSSPTRLSATSVGKLLEYAKSSYSVDDLDTARRVTPPKGGWPKNAPNGYLTMLYDLTLDLGETTNLAAQRPEIVEQLRTAYEQEPHVANRIDTARYPFHIE